MLETLSNNIKRVQNPLKVYADEAISAVNES